MRFTTYSAAQFLEAVEKCQRQVFLDVGFIQAFQFYCSSPQSKNRDERSFHKLSQASSTYIYVDINSPALS